MAFELENRFWKQTHGIKLAENLSPKTKKLKEFNKSTKKWEFYLKPDSEVANTQTPTI